MINRIARQFPQGNRSGRRRADAPRGTSNGRQEDPPVILKFADHAPRIREQRHLGIGHCPRCGRARIELRLAGYRCEVCDHEWDA